MKLNDFTAGIQKDLLTHVRCQFGWHGGMGDPPNNDTILAIARGTIEFIEGWEDIDSTGPSSSVSCEGCLI
ncbi:hypothetical protein LCGC14_2794440 [marine sediment metagenome]|uniref:Uncharacterized protein n=1 Tax=marine sediment metagenome TaxID=412755 RepID=A0A0F9BFY6_9ZZZZ